MYEIKVNLKEKFKIVILENYETVAVLRSKIKELFGIKTNDFDIYVGKHIVDEILYKLEIDKFVFIFNSTDITVLPQYEVSFFLSEYENIDNNDINLMLKDHTETINYYMNLVGIINDIDKSINEAENKISKLNIAFKKNTEGENYQEKTGLMFQHDKLNQQLKDYKNEVIDKKKLLDDLQNQIIDLKSLEKKSINNIIENKKLVKLIHSNYILIKKKQVEINQLDAKKQYLVKKRENEGLLLEAYINDNERKFSLIEFVKLYFYRQYKNEVIMKLFNGRQILFYKPEAMVNKSDIPTKGKLDICNIIDECEFEKIYESQISKRDEFYLNLKENLFIAIKTNVFIYSYRTNIISKINSLNEDHKGASFIYIPWNNSIYCISGITSILCEKLKLNKNYKNSTNIWEADSKLENPRAYYASYVQNDHNIYIIFGFNFFMKEISTSIQKFNTKRHNAKWDQILLKSEKVPRLIFASCLPSSDNEFYILGGKDNLDKDNYVIYLVNLKTETIIDSNLRLPSIVTEKDYIEERAAKNIFYQENLFISLRRENDNFESTFIYGLYDSKNFLHIINIKNFDYSYISQTMYTNKNPEKENKRLYLDEEEDDSDSDEDDGTNNKDKVIEKEMNNMENISLKESKEIKNEFDN